MFGTKIAIVVREDLAVWQKLNVTAFLTSGIVGSDGELLGERYEDAAGNLYTPLAIQPMIVLSADAKTINSVYRRAHGCLSISKICSRPATTLRTGRSCGNTSRTR